MDIKDNTRKEKLFSFKNLNKRWQKFKSQLILCIHKQKQIYIFLNRRKQCPLETMEKLNMKDKTRKKTNRTFWPIFFIFCKAVQQDFPLQRHFFVNLIISVSTKLTKYNSWCSKFTF